MGDKDLEEIQKDLKKAENRLEEILDEHGTGAHADGEETEREDEDGSETEDVSHTRRAVEDEA